LKQRVCVFCGSSSGLSERYAEAARATGRAIAQRGFGLVYGGGRIGLMGQLADAALASGGEVVGVIPRPLFERELGHTGVTELRVVRTMHERKAVMADLSDAFVALPGGFGTLDEFCEVLTWAQLGLHAKPCALLNVDGYFDPLLALFRNAVKEGFLARAHGDLVKTAADPHGLLESLASEMLRPRRSRVQNLR
jgi:uncharacterized protein (TIGR00730 family)